MRRHPLVGTRRIAASLAAGALLVASLAHAQSVWPDVGGPLDGARADGQHDAAVLIGVEDYAFVPDVSGASANINDGYSYLRKVRGVPLANIRLLRDSQATREEILASVDVAAAKASADGNLWIVFIDHGAPAPGGAEGLLVGADVQQSANSLTSRGVPQSELFAHARKGKQARIVAVLDALRLELGVGTAATPVERPDDGGGSGQQVRIEASEPDQTFEATLVAFDGSTRRCPNAVTIEQPCVFRNLPPGSARLKVTGDAEVSEKVEVSSGITRVQLYDHPGWGYSVGGVMSGVGLIGYFGGFFGLVSCSDDPSCSNALWITTLAGGAVTMLTGWGLVIWAFWKDYAHDFEEYEVESFPLADRPSRQPGGWAWQVAPWVTPDSAGLGLGVTLPSRPLRPRRPGLTRRQPRFYRGCR